MSEIKGKVHTCYHCGNTGVLELMATINSPNAEIDEDEFGNVVNYTLIENTEWQIYRCPVCNDPTIISDYTSPMIGDGWHEVMHEFPKTTVDLEGVPPDIKNAFESAVKTKGIDHAICLLSLRRALEMICRSKDADGTTLEKKIEDLVNKKILPEMLNGACWIIRQLGNDAAHADDVAFTRHDVEEVIGYVATVINYLYSMPCRIAELKARIEKRKADIVTSEE